MSQPGVAQHVAGLRRPALLAAAALMLGIFTHSLLPAWPIIWMGGILILLLLAIHFRGQKIRPNIAIFFAVFLAGLSLAQIEAFNYPRDEIGLFATDHPRLCEIEISLDDAPRILSQPLGSSRPLPPKQVAIATARKIKTWTGWQNATGQLLVQIAQPNPELSQGQIIHAFGLLERPGPAMNPGQFDWAKYYREQRILTSLQISHANAITILASPPLGFLNRLREISRHALALGFDSQQSLQHALLRALVLGDTDPELRDVQEQFRRTGTSHHLAISGMHVAVLGAVVLLVCRLLRFHPQSACVISLIGVIVYGIVALPSPPVIRSVVLCAAFGFGMLMRRSTDALQLLALSVLAMLIYHPLDIYNAGFQLSFGTVLGLMIFTRPLLAQFPEDRDVQIALDAQPRKSALAWMQFKRVFKTTLAAGIVAWIVSMPLIALYFEQLNPWAILASIALAPIVLLALIGGFAKVILTLLWPTFAHLFAIGAAWPIEAMQWGLRLLAKLPGSDIPFPAPPLWSIAIYYGLLLSLLIPWRFRFVRYTMRTLAIVGCLSLAIAPLREAFVALNLHSHDLKITLLNVGAGQCAIVEPPGAGATLIDAGSDTLIDSTRKAIAPYLRHQGRRSIHDIFISHANDDHFNAIPAIAAAYDLDAVFISPQFRAQSIGNSAAENLLATLDQVDHAPRTISHGDRIDIGSKTNIETLWPPAICNYDANNCGLVLRVTFAGKSVLFPADIQTPAERDLLASKEDLHANVLVAPHHGSMEKTTGTFIDAVNPATIVSSNDRTPSGKQRAFDELTRGKNVLRTDKCGAITIWITPEGKISVEPFIKRSR